jgi:hypothetical protein
MAGSKSPPQVKRSSSNADLSANKPQIKKVPAVTQASKQQSAAKRRPGEVVTNIASPRTQPKQEDTSKKVIQRVQSKPKFEEPPKT